MNYKCLIFGGVLSILFCLNPVFSQSGSNVKVTVSELEQYDNPLGDEAPGLRALPEGKWVQTRVYGWNMTSLGPSKFREFPPGCDLELTFGRGGALLINNGKDVYQRKEVEGLDQIVASPDGKKVLLYFSEMYGDVARYNVYLIDLEIGKEEKINKDPVAFANFSPDSQYILMEGDDLVDASVGKRSSLHLGDFAYTEVLGWAEDSRSLVILSFENWINPEHATKYLLTLN